MSERRLIWGFAVAGALLRLAIASRNLDVVDRLFVPDDTYYTLSIARSLAAGLGPTVDGHTLTSGFQPLLAFLTAPVFALSSNPDTALRFVLVLGALADGFCILALGDLAARVGRRFAGPFAAALWALSPIAVGNALGGLETSLALALQLWLVVLWCRLLAEPSRRLVVACGVLAGLSLLARVDAAFLVFFLGVSELLRRNARGVAALAGVASLVVAPWWLYSWAHFGSIVPESGAAVRDIVGMHQELYLKLPMQIGWALGTLFGILGDPTWLKQALFDSPGAAWAALLGAVVLGGAFARRCLPARGSGVPVSAFAAHGVATFGFYAVYLPALWFFPRYLAAMEAVLALALAALLSRLDGARLRKLSYAVGAGCLVYTASTALPWLFLTPERTPSNGLHGAKGYREAARDVLSSLPQGSTVGALQSGALSYYAPSGIRVVNLDGVVDSAARRAARDHRLSRYARERNVTHFADWKFNFEAFVRRSNPEALPRNVKFIGAARPQGDDRFQIYELEW